jgi:hypothetical protein
MATYQVLELDVWGNEEDGFDVNDVYRTHIKIECDFEDDDSILIALKNAGYLPNYTVDELQIVGDENFLSINDDDSWKPLLQLELVGR